MASLNLTVPEDLKLRLAARATESGYPNVEQFVQAVLQATAEEEIIDDDIEELLARRLNDPRPNIEFNAAFREQFRDEVKNRRESRGS